VRNPSHEDATFGLPLYVSMSTISVSFTETVIRKLKNRKANIHKQNNNTLHENFKQTRGDTIGCIFKYQLANAGNKYVLTEQLFLYHAFI